MCLFHTQWKQIRIWSLILSLHKQSCRKCLYCSCFTQMFTLKRCKQLWPNTRRGRCLCLQKDVRFLSTRRWRRTHLQVLIDRVGNGFCSCDTALVSSPSFPLELEYPPDLYAVKIWKNWRLKTFACVQHSLLKICGLHSMACTQISTCFL